MAKFWFLVVAAIGMGFCLQMGDHLSAMMIMMTGFMVASA